MPKIGVGLVGSQFITTQHYEALAHVPDAEVLAVASPTIEHVRTFAEKRRDSALVCRLSRNVPDARDSARRVGHAELSALRGRHGGGGGRQTRRAGKADGHEPGRVRPDDRRLPAAGVKLMYAEELCFAPKYTRLKQLVDSGALGKLHLVKQMEKHSGPHAAWFYNTDLSGGGVALDMGCHAVEFFRWLLSGPDCRERPQRDERLRPDGRRTSHADKTRGDDEALIIVEFENGCTGLAEESWTKPGGMDDRAEVYGSAGQAYADLLRGNSIHTYSERGYDYAVEKASQTSGWSFTIYEENWNYGFPQEMAHFVECVRDDKQPIVTRRGRPSHARDHHGRLRLGRQRPEDRDCRSRPMPRTRSTCGGREIVRRAQ